MVSRQLYYITNREEIFDFNNKKCRVYAACSVSQTPIYSILEEEKPNQREQIKIRAVDLDKYLPDDFTPNQKVELILDLVKEWHDRQCENTKGTVCFKK